MTGCVSASALLSLAAAFCRSGLCASAARSPSKAAAVFTGAGGFVISARELAP